MEVEVEEWAGGVMEEEGVVCGEESLLKAQSCYCNGRLRNATAYDCDQRTRETERERGGEGGSVNQNVTMLTTLCHRGFMIC